MRKSSLVIFDIDDTLSRTAAIHQAVFTKSLYELGVKEMDTNFGGYQHHTDSYISKVIFEKDQKIPFEAKHQEHFENKITDGINKVKIEEIEGAKEFVDSLEKQSEFAVCFATGSLRRAAVLKLDSIGIAFNPFLLVASDHIHERENILREAIRNAKQHFKLENFDRMISIGDGIWDLKTAKNLQLEFIGIGEKNKEQMEQEGCKKHWQDFTNRKANEL